MNYCDSLLKRLVPYGSVTQSGCTLGHDHRHLHLRHSDEWCNNSFSRTSVDAEGAIATTHAAARYQVDDNKLTAMAQDGRFWEYEVLNGMLIPLEGEVGWEHPEGT